MLLMLGTRMCLDLCLHIEVSVIIYDIIEDEVDNLQDQWSCLTTDIHRYEMLLNDALGC